VETNPAEELSYHCTNCLYAYRLPDYPQESVATVNQPEEARNTQHGIGRTLTMNKDEVEEDPSEDESTKAF